MDTGPPIRFYLAERAQPVGPNDPLQATALPLTRTGIDREPHPPDTLPATYGDYFRAIGRFLKRNPGGALGPACSELLGTPVGFSEIDHIDVFLVKHGAFYHPCRVVPLVAGHKLELVLNGAVSQSACQVMDREYRCLERLGAEFAYEFIPRVYGSGIEIESDGGGRTIRMFLAQWFSGFHECHLSRDPAGGVDRIRVWETGGQNEYLTPSQSADYYRRCALILTCYYNPLSSEQIFPWHHAAGDFIVSRRMDDIDVRLITVRDYQPLFREPLEAEAGAGTTAEDRILDGLLLFFLTLSVRMRLDRLDGVGDIVWAPEAAAAGTVSGYFHGLAEVCDRCGFPPDLPGHIRCYLLRHSDAELADLCREIAIGYPPDSEERLAVMCNGAEHARTLRRLLAAGKGAGAT